MYLQFWEIGDIIYIVDIVSGHDIKWLKRNFKDNLFFHLYESPLTPLLILPLTFIFNFGKTPGNGRNSRQNMSNPVGKSY